MMVQAHIQHQRADLLALQQHARSGFRVVTHGGELTVGQLTGLVQDLIGNGHLADVVQQASQPGLTHLILGKFQLPSQRDHQRAHGHRVHVGVFIGILQARQADQRIGVAHH